MSWRTGLAKFITSVVVAALLSTAAIIASPYASAAPISQVSPTSGSIDVARSAEFTVTLAVDPSFVGATFANATLGFSITPSGVLSTPGPLTVAGSPYLVTGTDGDGSGDTGTWSYSLTVTPDLITQGPPTSAVTNNSATFTSMLSAASGFVGPVTFITTVPGFTISNRNVLQGTGALGANGSPYSITGTDSDAYGDTGTWTFSLTVTGPPQLTTRQVARRALSKPLRQRERYRPRRRGRSRRARSPFRATPVLSCSSRQIQIRV